VNRVMPYYPPDQRRRAFSQDPRRGAVPPGFRQNFEPPNDMRRYDRSNMFHQQQVQGYSQHGPRRRPASPFMYNQQPPNDFPEQGPRRRFPENLNTMMSHAGKIYEGVNIVRQIGSFFNMFR